MTSKKVYRHPLIETDERLESEENINEYQYSIAEYIITLVSVILIANSLFCFSFFFNMDEDPNPMVAFGLIPIIYFILLDL